MEMNGTAAAKQLYMCYAEDFVSNDIKFPYKYLLFNHLMTHTNLKPFKT